MLNTYFIKLFVRSNNQNSELSELLFLNFLFDIYETKIYYPVGTRVNPTPTFGQLLY